MESKVYNRYINKSKDKSYLNHLITGAQVLTLSICLPTLSLPFIIISQYLNNIHMKGEY